MKKYIKKIGSVVIIILAMIFIQMNVYSHSGRTDANGGHKDNQNKSGLGSYHYHCGGHPAHLHPNGVCPYSASSQSGTSSSSSGSGSGSSSRTSSGSSSGSSSRTSSGSSSGSGSGSSSGSSSSPSPSPSSTSITTTTIPSTVEVTEIQIEEKIEDMEIGESQKLTVTIIPNNATDKNVTWQSSDESIATVDSIGEIIAKKSGVVSITATTTNGKTNTITINVKEPVKEETTLTNASIEITNTETGNTINDTANNEEGSTLGGIITLGLLGGGGYWGYKKYKNKKQKI